MSKRLVKTAKQQFEERLSELRLVERWEMCPTEIYYGCEMPNGVFVLLRDQDGEYKELQYGMRYLDLLMTESFLSVTSERFVNGKVPIRPLFDWYASADHDDEPFNLLDIYMSELEESHHTFEDLYEEVTDVRIITAKEQWEKESTGAETISTLANGSVYKVVQTDASLTFFVYQNGEYFKEVYPPLEELRKDAHFAMAYLSHVRALHDSDLCSALDWIQTGKYTMDGLTLLDIYEITNCKEHVCYHDKEETAQELPDNVVEMNMYDPFNWLRESGNGTWGWISEYCNSESEYGRLDALYRIIEGTLNVEDEFCNPPTEEEIKEDYQKNFPLLLAGVFENLADAIRKGELTFVMDYSK